MNSSKKLCVVAADGERRHTVSVRRKNYAECSHLGVEVDESTGMVTCQKCDKQIDPVQFLIHWANNREANDRTAQEIYGYRLAVRKKAEREQSRPSGSRSYKALWELAEQELGEARAEIWWLKDRISKLEPTTTTSPPASA